jgi:hypothetical protein
MRLDLIPHPATGSGPVRAARVSVERMGTAFSLQYALGGDLDRVRTPSWRGSVRTEHLWRHTCFEAFLRAEGEEAYLEFNFSPSGEWAAYRFDRYRSGRTEIDVPAPAIGGHGGPDGLAVLVALEGLPPGRRWRIGLSAVVEDREGRLSYWALAHPPGDPDFHHPDCFALQFPPAPAE